MAQGSRSRRIDSHVHLLRKSKLCQLPVLFGKWLNLDEPPVGSFYERVFTPPRLFWLFLAQVLSADRSCREAVQIPTCGRSLRLGSRHMAGRVYLHVPKFPNSPQIPIPNSTNSASLKEFVGGCWHRQIAKSMV